MRSSSDGVFAGVGGGVVAVVAVKAALIAPGLTLMHGVTPGIFGAWPAGVRRDELRHVDCVLADDDVLGHDRAREAAVLDRVQDAVDGPLAADVEVGSVVRLRRADVGRRPMRARVGQRVAAGAALGEQHGAVIERRLALGDADLLGSVRHAVTSAAVDAIAPAIRETLSGRLMRAGIIRESGSTMARRQLTLALVLPLAASIAACGSTQVVGSARAVHVALTEYRLSPQRVQAHCGPADAVRPQRGRLTHNLAVTRGGHTTGATQPIAPGHRRRLTVMLRKGNLCARVDDALRPGPRAVRNPDREIEGRPPRATNRVTTPAPADETFASHASAIVLRRRQPKGSAPGRPLPWTRVPRTAADPRVPHPAYGGLPARPHAIKPRMSSVADPELFREVFGRFATGVAVITGSGPAGVGRHDRQRALLAVAGSAAGARVLREPGPDAADRPRGRALWRQPAHRRAGGARGRVRVQAARGGEARGRRRTGSSMACR